MCLRNTNPVSEPLFAATWLTQDSCPVPMSYCSRPTVPQAHLTLGCLAAALNNAFQLQQRRQRRGAAAVPVARLRDVPLSQFHL